MGIVLIKEFDIKEDAEFFAEQCRNGNQRQRIKDKILDLMAKSKVYLEGDEKPPEGYQEMRGPDGGRYYLTAPEPKLPELKGYDQMMLRALSVNSPEEVEKILGPKLAEILNRYTIISKGNAPDEVVNKLFNELKVIVSDRWSNLPLWGGGDVEADFDDAIKSGDRLDRIVAIDSFMNAVHEDNVKPITIVGGHSYDFKTDDYVRKVLDYLSRNTDSEDMRKLTKRREDAEAEYYKNEEKKYKKLSTIKLTESDNAQKGKFMLQYFDAKGNRLPLLNEQEDYFDTRRDAEDAKEDMQQRIREADSYLHGEDYDAPQPIYESFEKSRVYLKPGEVAPKGESVKTGPLGGKYYEPLGNKNPEMVQAKAESEQQQDSESGSSVSNYLNAVIKAGSTKDSPTDQLKLNYEIKNNLAKVFGHCKYTYEVNDIDMSKLESLYREWKQGTWMHGESREQSVLNAFFGSGKDSEMYEKLLAKAFIKNSDAANIDDTLKQYPYDYLVKLFAIQKDLIKKIIGNKMLTVYRGCNGKSIANKTYQIGQEVAINDKKGISRWTLNYHTAESFAMSRSYTFKKDKRNSAVLSCKVPASKIIAMDGVFGAGNFAEEAEIDIDPKGVKAKIEQMHLAN